MRRTEIIAAIRRSMQENGFIEFTTPLLTASSPEGARDFWFQVVFIRENFTRCHKHLSNTNSC